MSFARHTDLRRHTPWLISLLMAIASGLLLYETQSEAEIAARGLETARQTRDRLASQLAQASDEAKSLDALEAQLAQLAQRGIIGEGQRLNWPDFLKTSQQRLRIPGLQFEIGPSQPLDAHEEHRWMSTPLVLHLRLLHEEDLLRLLAYLSDHATALTLTRRCQLSPIAVEAPARYAGLQAICEMQWLTLKPAGAAR